MVNTDAGPPDAGASNAAWPFADAAVPPLDFLGGNRGAEQHDSFAGGWDRSGLGITGFSFRITGPKLPAASTGFRLIMRPSDSDVFTVYCADLETDAAEGTLGLPLRDVTLDCWNREERDSIDNHSRLRAISWQLMSSPYQDEEQTDFDFCIDELRWVLTPAL